MRILMIFGTLMTLALGGCTPSHGEPPPSCDGTGKRPLNPEKWNGVLSIDCGERP